MNRRLGRHAAAVAWVLGWTPNLVTAVSFILSLGGMIVVAAAPHGVLWSIAATVLLLGGYALDSADGQLARLRGGGSIAGEWVDHVVDAARLPMFHIAVAAHFVIHDEADWLVILAVAFALLSSVWFFAQILADKLSSGPGSGPDQSPPWVSFAKLPYDVGLLYLTVLLLSVESAFAGTYTGLFVVTAAVAAASFRRKYRALGLQQRAAPGAAGGTR